MNPITQYLTNTLRGHLDEHHTVVWYDPRGEYATYVDSLDAAEALGGARLFRYDPARGYMQLRRDLEPLWAAPQPPRLLIYVADERPPAVAAPLLEYERGGAALWPGANPATRDSALAAVARAALSGVLPPAEIARLADQLESDPPQLTFDELDRAVGSGRSFGVLDALYPRASSPTEYVLAFLSDDAQDGQLIQRKAVKTVSDLLQQALGPSFKPPAAKAGPEALRAAAAHYVLLAELGEALPALPGPAAAEPPAARAATAALAAAWRDSAQMAESYDQRARAVEAEAGLAALLRGADPGWGVLAAVQTFPAAEAQLQAAVEEALAGGATAELLALAAARRGGFWASRAPHIRARWSAILSAGRLLHHAARVRAGLRPHELSAAAIWAAYTNGRDGQPPWCLLDRYQRHFERDQQAVDAHEQSYEALLRLAAAARAAYLEAAGALAERFVRAYEAAGFAPPGRALQADIFATHARPALGDGPVAYILVDAFRYEMAHELLEQLEAARRPSLSAAAATPPTVTEVGMAALMPGAERGIILSAARDKLLVSLSGAALPDRQARIEQFGRAVDLPYAAVRLHELVPLSDKKLQARIQQAKIVLVTATEEIDGVSENTPTVARRQLDSVFDELRRALGALFHQGIRTAIITADHGHLFLGEPLGPSDLIDRPSGQGVMEKRRVWVGHGGDTPPGVLRAPLAAFGLAGEAGEQLELLTPYGLAAFRARGGATTYFHGGLSLPELAVPVLVAHAMPTDTPVEVGRFQWAIQPGSKTISSRVLVVNVTGESPDLMPSAPPRVSVEVRAGSRLISSLISAGDGFHEQTGEIETAAEPDNRRRIQPISAVVQIDGELGPEDTSASIVLLDATTGAVLARLDNVPVTITI